ncbi:MAG: ABC transporter permease [Bacteroidota bacterium]
MNKIWLVFQREYLHLVRKPSFLIGTFLVPLAIVAYFGIIILSSQLVEGENFTVLVEEENAELFSMLKARVTDKDSITYKMTDLPAEKIKDSVLNNDEILFLNFPDTTILQEKKQQNIQLYYGGKTPSRPASREIERQAEKAIKEYRKGYAQITPEQQKALDVEIEFEKKKQTEEGVSQSNEDIATFIGLGIFFLMYTLISIYGSILIQGVVEEKSNRIVEIIVSSVKPFQLLLGKTLAIGSAGITQFLLWVGLVVAFFFGMGMLGFMPDQSAVANQPGVDVEAQLSQAENIMIQAANFDWSVLWFFPIFFLGGFFLFGSLMAGAASAVDNIQDAQQFLAPINILMVLPALFFSNLMQNPNSLFATFASLFPFFSPVTMLFRMSVTEVPWYEVALSIVILILTFLACIWVAGRIYRTGILMYGKKPKVGELLKWITKS